MSGILPTDQTRSLPAHAVPPEWNERSASIARPASLTSFVGRAREVDLVTDLLRRLDVRLLTLTGTGGIGKTRLASRVIDILRDAFTDGSVFVPLASIRDPNRVFASIAHDVGVPDAPDQPPLNRLQSFLADRHLLLVLDNVEHLLAAAPSLPSLLEVCPRLTILCTSRTRLGVSGEHLFAVPPLTVPDSDPLLPLDHLREIESVRLFIERARAITSGFTLTANNASTVAELCRRLDGLPLAIELAAARVNVLPPHALLARLEHRLDLLTDGPRDAPPRLRDMREAITWSHDLLTEHEQVIFRRLGVFVGGFTLAAAQAVAGGGGEDVLKGIGALVAASLASPIEGVGDEPRFTLLETIREFALEQLVASGEAPSVRRAHAEFFCWLAESAIPYYDGPELPTYNARVDRELDNCRAAMTWALDTGAAETGVRLAGALWRVWWYSQIPSGKPLYDRVAEGGSWCERMLAAQNDLPVEPLTEALAGVGCLSLFWEDIERAQAAGEDLLGRAQAVNYAYGIYWAHYLLGKVAERQGSDPRIIYLIGSKLQPNDQDNAARQHYQAALSVAPAVRNPQNHAAMVLKDIGVIMERTGELDAAETQLRKALALCRASRNPNVLGQTLFYLGRVVRDKGDLKEAALLLRECLAAHQAQGDVSGIHAVLVDMALVAFEAGQLSRVVRLLSAAGAFPTHPGFQLDYEQIVERARTALGITAFTAVWEDGKDLSWDEILAEVDALADTISDVPSPSPAPNDTHGLSPRELEVLCLVAEGSSNRAIAETLSLSERTVEAHVLHIVTKLGLQSRTAAATYAVRHGLA